MRENPFLLTACHHFQKEKSTGRNRQAEVKLPQTCAFEKFFSSIFFPMEAFSAAGLHGFQALIRVQ